MRETSDARANCGCLGPVNVMQFLLLWYRDVQSHSSSWKLLKIIFSMEKVANTFSVSKEKHDLIVKRNVDSHNISSLITECIQQLPYETQQDAAAWTP